MSNAQKHGNDPNGSQRVIDELTAKIENASSQLKVEFSLSGNVEEGNYVTYSVSLIDTINGAVAAGSIDITGISAVLSKSTGGAAFSTSGITQPTFTKSIGFVSCAYRFLAAEWKNGDMAQLVLSGLKATIDGVVYYINAKIWTNTLQELANIESKIDAGFLAGAKDATVAKEATLDSLGITTKNLILFDCDTFDKASADANTARWNPFYAFGSEGGRSDISTSTANKLQIAVEPDATPTFAGYTVFNRNIINSRLFETSVDVDVVFGTPAARVLDFGASTGFFLTDRTLDWNNFIFIVKETFDDGAGTINRFAVYATFGGKAQTPIYLTSTTLSFALKLERYFNVYRAYYSLTKSPNEVWVLLGQFEDTAGSMGGQFSVGLISLSPGSAQTQTVVGDFDNFYIYKQSDDLAETETSYLAAGAGAIGDYERAGSILRATADTVSVIDTQTDFTEKVFEKSITVAANAGATTVATVTDQPCLIEAVIIHADAAQTADLTACPITGGASGVIEFIDAATAIRANLDVADKQIAWANYGVPVRLAATKTIVITPSGTGATALDLTVIIKYRPCVAGGYLA